MAGITNQKNTIIVAGIGSPVLKDGASGYRAVDLARQHFTDNTITFKQVPAGGVDLLYELEGFSKGIVIAPDYSDNVPPGEIIETVIDRYSANSICRLPGDHGVDLSAVIAMGTRCGYTMPDKIVVINIYGSDLFTLGHQPTTKVMHALNNVVKTIDQWVTQWNT